MDSGAHEIPDHIVKTRERFNLLKGIHSLFDKSLPTTKDVETGRYGLLSGVELADMKNHITLLRSSILFLPISLGQIDLDQNLPEADSKRLSRAFDTLLGLFESSVQNLEGVKADSVAWQYANCIRLFPNLVNLHILRRRNDKEVTRDNGCGPSDSAMSIDEQCTTPDSTDSFEKQTSLQLTSYIDFPSSPEMIFSCLSSVESLEKIVCDIFPEAVRGSNLESQLGEVKENEIRVIRAADTFSRKSASIFELLAGCFSCEAEHCASLHLSGFDTRQLEFRQVIDNHCWKPACFSHPPTAADSPETNLKDTIRNTMAAAENQILTIRDFLNETIGGDECVLETAPCSLSTTITSPSTLDHSLTGPNSQANCRPDEGKLNRMGKKVFGVLLACSLFQLWGSPWLQHKFEGGNILVLPNQAPLRSWDKWRPHVAFHLGHDEGGPKSLPEDVAALGVLILELETERSAGWTDEDEDYGTAKKSNKVRLLRILEEWKTDIPDAYRDIGHSCYTFDTLVEKFHHPKVDPRLKGLAVLFTRIVSPLYQRLMSDFSAAGILFQEASGLSVPTRYRRESSQRDLVLYDDSESAEPSKQSECADKWINRVTDDFSCMIGRLRGDYKYNLADKLCGHRQPGEVRVAILDTGIDPTDRIIDGARSRIIEKLSWVGSRECWTDTYGHGTHVARLLIKIAPTAMIYIAKISEGKTVNQEDMPRIAEAIDHAVKVWDVDIISMSFGFDYPNDAIAKAIDRAAKADKLMFAAASNEGGNKPRSRPGRDPNVICIHACDGKGNKGDMNPNPEKYNRNFTTLGVAIKSRWKQKTVYKSGTSFATPVAAAIAACILEFANFKCKLQEPHRKLLYRQTGMAAVFGKISQERDKYDYVQPGPPWDEEKMDTLAREIEAILESI